MEEDNNNPQDPKLKSKIEDLKVGSPAGLRCDRGNPIRKMCINPNCPRFSLTCGNYNCDVCREDEHELCASISFNGVTKLINSKVDFQQEAMFRLTEIETIFTHELTKMNYFLMESGPLIGIEEHFRQKIQDIYRRNNAKCLRGREAS